MCSSERMPDICGKNLLEGRGINVKISLRREIDGEWNWLGTVSRLGAVRRHHE
jgi:hypothetical protein